MRIDLQGANNTRNFVGIKNCDGWTIISERFIRSNNLHNLTHEDIELLNRYNVEKIIDLRTDVESSQKPDKCIKNEVNINIPIFKASAIGVTHERGTDAHATGDIEIPNMEKLYEHMVMDEDCKENLSRIMNEIVDFAVDETMQDSAIVWHCTEGKDRCGIVSALFLSMLDVDKSVIIEDYLATNKVAEKRAQGFYDNVVEKTGNMEKAAIIKRAFMANESFIQAAFTAILSKHDSIVDYIVEDLKVAPEKIIRLKKLCLQKNNQA